MRPAPSATTTAPCSERLRREAADPRRRRVAAQAGARAAAAPTDQARDVRCGGRVRRRRGGSFFAKKRKQFVFRRNFFPVRDVVCIWCGTAVSFMTGESHATVNTKDWRIVDELVLFTLV